MKRYSIAFLLLFILSGCSKSLNVLAPDGYLAFQNEAVIIGYESITDECNGGYMINIIDPQLNNQVFTAQSLPPNDDIDSGMAFPVKVVLNWKEEIVNCQAKRIISVSRIQKVF